MRFRRELYSKVALLKAAYNFTDIAYIHLDADGDYYYVTTQPKGDGVVVKEEDFLNEILTQSLRHEVYQQTKNIRELLLARAMATSVIVDEKMLDDSTQQNHAFDEDEILKDWFGENEKTET